MLFFIFFLILHSRHCHLAQIIHSEASMLQQAKLGPLSQSRKCIYLYEERKKKANFFLFFHSLFLGTLVVTLSSVYLCCCIADSIIVERSKTAEERDEKVKYERREEKKKKSCEVMLRLVDFNYGLFSCQFDMVIKHFPNAWNVKSSSIVDCSACFGDDEIGFRCYLLVGFYTLTRLWRKRGSRPRGEMQNFTDLLSFFSLRRVRLSIVC